MAALIYTQARTRPVYIHLSEQKNKHYIVCQYSYIRVDLKAFFLLPHISLVSSKKAA